MGNVPKELIKTQSIAVRDLQIGCRGRENSKKAAYAMRKPEKLGPEEGVCGQTAWRQKAGVQASPEPVLGSHSIVVHHHIKYMALAARGQESRQAWLEEKLKSWSQLGVAMACVLKSSMYGGVEGSGAAALS